MKNKTEITRKQLDEIGNLIEAAECIIANACNSGSVGPSEKSEFATKYEGEYWWNDWLYLHKKCNKAANVFSTLHGRMNSNEEDA